MPNGASEQRPVLRYVGLVYGLSLPLWVLGPLADRWLRGAIPIDLPAAALQAVNPAMAATILSYRQGGRPAVRALVGRLLGRDTAGGGRWFAVALLLKPAISLASYAVQRLLGLRLPRRGTPLKAAAAMLPVFLVAAAAEEVGWSGYAIEPLQERWGAEKAGAALGAVWATWHVVPMLQAGRSPGWVAWKVLDTVAARVVIVSLYNGAGGSVPVAVLCHAMANVSEFMFPYYGSGYDPRISSVLTWLVAAVAMLLSRRRAGRG